MMKLLFATLFICGPVAASVVYTESGTRKGTITLSAGGQLTVGKGTLHMSSVLALDMDDNPARTPSKGVRFVDGTFLSGHFLDYSTGRDNDYLCETFGKMTVPKGLASSIYLGGYPGSFTKLEDRSQTGVVLKNGNFVEADILYVTTRYVGIRDKVRTRKINAKSIYCVKLRPAKPARRPWRVLSRNGDVVFGSMATDSFKLNILGKEKKLAFGWASTAIQAGRQAAYTVDVPAATHFQMYRNAEGKPLQLTTKRVALFGQWQRADSKVVYRFAGGASHLAYRVQREPGFYRGKMIIDITSGGKTLRSIELEGRTSTEENVLNLRGAKEVTIHLRSGGDGAYGDRVIWERLSFF